MQQKPAIQFVELSPLLGYGDDTAKPNTFIDRNIISANGLTLEYPILDDMSDPVVDSPFRVRLHSGITTPLIVAVPPTKGCEGCFAKNAAEGTCAQLPSCDNQFRADGEDCIFTLCTGVTHNGS